jgi:hypothetical protein
MRTYINPNKIVKAEIIEPDTYIISAAGNPSYGWRLILILEGNDDVLIECSSEEECIAWCNSFNLIQVK